MRRVILSAAFPIALALATTAGAQWYTLRPAAPVILPPPVYAIRAADGQTIAATPAEVLTPRRLGWRWLGPRRTTVLLPVQ
jgi:hypothetical protein